MPTLEDIKTKLIEKFPYLREKYGVGTLGIFGSYVRGDQTDQSDVDILVTFSRPIGLAFVSLADEIEEFLGVKVDLVTRDSIKPRYWEHIVQDLIYVKA